MATVAAGARLQLRAAGGPISLRSLAPVVLADLWSIPVLAHADRMLDGLAGELELPTDRGVLRLAAHLVSDGPVLSLRPGLGVPLQIQRRDDVRAWVRLPVRAAPQSSVRAAKTAGRATLEGVTVNLSGGGVGVRLDGAQLGDRGRLYAELDLPGGLVVPTVLAVVDAGPDPLRARFEQISRADRERLVRLVFEQQRRELAARKRLLDAIGNPGG